MRDVIALLGILLAGAHAMPVVSRARGERGALWDRALALFEAASSG